MAGDQGLASGNTYWGGNLTAAVLNGTIPQWRLDDMVTRIMSVSGQSSENYNPQATIEGLEQHCWNSELTQFTGILQGRP
jgi:hypothetical protein